MASITTRKLDDRVKANLRVRAANHGRSMEEEARGILRCALAGQDPSAHNLAQSIRKHVEPFGGVELACRAEAAYQKSTGV